jgi:hypothetical protein
VWEYVGVSWVWRRSLQRMGLADMFGDCFRCGFSAL